MICVPYVDSSVYEVQVLQALVPWALHTSNGKSNHCPEEQGYCLKLLSKGTSGVLSQEQFLFGASALRILIMIISLSS
jgi:hypothetical protein